MLAGNTVGVQVPPFAQGRETDGRESAARSLDESGWAVLLVGGERAEGARRARVYPRPQKRNLVSCAPRPMSSMAFRIVNGVCVVVHSAESASDAEWDHYVDTLSRRAADFQGVLVLTYGGAPTGHQRERVLKAWLRTPYRPSFAVLTNSLFARAVVNALSWVVRERIKAFDESDLDGAFAYLALNRAQREAVIATLASLKRTLGLAA